MPLSSTVPISPLSPRTYVVQRGDNLTNIAGRYEGVSWRDIAAANRLDDPDLIYPGEVLSIPRRGPFEEDSFEPAPGDATRPRASAARASPAPLVKETPR